MSSKSWGQWLKVAKKQLRHLGRTIDQELGNVLERQLPSRSGTMAKIRVPIRSTPARFPVRGSNYRNFHQVAGSAVKNDRVRLTSNISSVSVVRLFSSGSKFPRGTPRGLFTNWNIANARFSGRMYSTASIKFTHEAVSNLSLSLRCFFNALDGSVLAQGDGKHAGSKPLASSLESTARLSRKDISLIRDMEVFEMIRNHKADCLYSGSERVGCYIEFAMPDFRLKNILPSVSFADPSTLDVLNQEVSNYTTKLKDIESAVRRVCDSYGALPVSLEANRLRIHFPNLTMLEAEKRVTELGVTLGSIHPEEFQSRDACGGRNILSSFNSVADLPNSALDYSPVLSESSSSWANYEIV
ncbi:hypothetical protein HG536_0A08480 [Torulaspora globosa]|uniref:Stationary phase protein 5 n=1 Tax=Torulaspora globosa TaxID=48254 RepID=A0A7G3ZBZ7_9SACH|nr:uncharacterized protein HG536_0A08480 [Torulaspora globosa]QLL31033.1 hypothetical protein HG536_0A08480 [Torulaspora globosa]